MFIFWFLKWSEPTPLFPGKHQGMFGWIYFLQLPAVILSVVFVILSDLEMPALLAVVHVDVVLVGTLFLDIVSIVSFLLQSVSIVFY